MKDVSALGFIDCFNSVYDFFSSLQMCIPPLGIGVDIATIAFDTAAI